jgi:hypothetical protein
MKEIRRNLYALSLNVSWNCLDIHLEARGQKTAIIFESEAGEGETAEADGTVTPLAGGAARRGRRG